MTVTRSSVALVSLAALSVAAAAHAQQSSWSGPRDSVVFSTLASLVTLSLVVLLLR